MNSLASVSNRIQVNSAKYSLVKNIWNTLYIQFDKTLVLQSTTSFIHKMEFSMTNEVFFNAQIIDIFLSYNFMGFFFMLNFHKNSFKIVLLFWRQTEALHLPQASPVLVLLCMNERTNSASHSSIHQLRHPTACQDVQKIIIPDIKTFL